MSKVTRITRQDRADQGFRADRGKGNALKVPISVNAASMMPPEQVMKPTVQTIAAVEKNVMAEKLKVAAYCRVSTLMESQEGSIISQRRHYRDVIINNPEWELADIYLEAGVSGTKAEIRPELQRLITDCKAGKVNLILTKSISRFARNTSDCLEMVRTLIALGVDIWFEKENIHTGTMESEFMLSILACLAEDESRSISGNLKWGLRKRFQNSTYKMSKAPYGYRREGTELIIVPEQAEIVRGIFHAALSGCGGGAIAEDLNKRGIPSPGGKEWTSTGVLALMRNPAYIGDMLYQKTYMENFQQRRNDGQLDQYYDKGHHEPIVSEETFELANESIQRRRQQAGNPEQDPQIRKRYAFSGRVFCAYCGSPMHRVPSGHHIALRCESRRKDKDACPQKNEMVDNIKNAFITCLNKLAYAQTLAPKYRVIDSYLEFISAGEQERHSERLTVIDDALKENKLEMDTLTAETMIDYFRTEHRERKTALEAEQATLMREKLLLTTQPFTSSKIEKLREFVTHWVITDRTEDFPDEGFVELVEKAVLTSQEKVAFHFYGGLVLTESLRRTCG